ncbi:MAG: hypothetical protein KF774_18065 [Planctomyces sp.]|nr:hypothetical protein [Planctomyces sp.]
MRRIRRSWFRGLALFVALALLGAVFLAVQSTRALEAEADAIRRLGANFSMTASGRPRGLLETWGDQLGVKFLSRDFVDRCEYRGRLADLPDLSPLGELSQLESVRLGQLVEDARAVMTDERLAPLATRRGLRGLSIAGRIGVTDAFLKDLARSGRLEVLAIHSDALTDRGLEALAGCRGLRALRLGGARIRDGLADLPLENLELLSLHDVDAHAANLQCLSRCARLKVFGLTGFPADDPLLQVLSGLPCLEELDLSRTAITDAGLDVFVPGPALRSLNLIDTTVSDAAAARLFARCPSMTVRYGHHSEGRAFSPRNPPADGAEPAADE